MSKTSKVPEPLLSLASLFSFLALWNVAALFVVFKKFFHFMVFSPFEFQSEKQNVVAGVPLSPSKQSFQQNQ
jgi:hypothetical protein